MSRSVCVYVCACVCLCVIRTMRCLGYLFAETERADQGLQNELTTPVTNEAIVQVVDEWILSRRKAALPCSLWASRILSSHLNVPICLSPPPGIVLQALILGQDLPPVFLTVYDETEFEDNRNGAKEVHDYAIAIVQKHSRLLMNYCSCEYVVLPCTIEEGALSPEQLQNEVDKQREKTRSYYRGPHSLSEATYESVKAAVTVLSAGSYVPCFLDSEEPKEVS